MGNKPYATIEDVLDDPSVHPHDKAEIATFARFLLNHGAPNSKWSVCRCGVAARLEGDDVYAVPNPECECPCHEPGYAAK